MPIRINLLAEQQEAEQTRRLDPVKRTLWMGGLLLGAMILFSLSLQFRLHSVKADLAGYLVEVQQVDPEAKRVLGEIRKIAEIESRTQGLTQYATNRFYWAIALDALQHTLVDGVRVVSLTSTHTYATNAEMRSKTNITFLRPVQSAWRFWSSPPATNYSMALSNRLAVLTNKTEFATNKIAPSFKIAWETNAVRATAMIEIVKPAIATERILLTIHARDYSEIPGHRVDEFSRTIATFPYFGERLVKGEGQGIRLKERAIRPEFDPQDELKNRAFIPFSIECRYEEKVRTL